MIQKQTAKDLLVASLLELSDTFPIDKISVKDICKNCSLSTQTFYNNFMNKQELILYVYQSVGEELIQKIGTDGYRWNDMIIDLMRFFRKHSTYALNAFKNTYGYDSFLNLVANQGLTTYEKYIKEKFNLKKLPEDILFYIKIYCFSGIKLLEDWLTTGMSLSPERFAELYNNGMPEPLKAYLLK